MACMVAGCSTVQSTSLVGGDENTSGATEKKGERRAVLEVTVPEPLHVAQDKALRSTWRTADYHADRARGFHAFVPPTELKLTPPLFARQAAMLTPTGPFIQVELREKEKITVSKTHEVVTRGLLSSASKAEQKTLPVYSYYGWPDDHPTYAGEVITVRVEQFAKRPGAWSDFTGTTNEQGQLRIPLAPMLRTRALLGKGTDLTLVVSCPGRGLTVEIFLPYEVIGLYAQQHHRL